MKDEKRATTGQASGSLPNRILGSLRDALNAASRDDRSGEITLGDKGGQLAASAAADPRKQTAGSARPPEIPAALAAQPPASAAEAVREAKSVTREPKHYEAGEPSTQSLRASAPAAARQATPATGVPPKTQAVRGRPKVLRNAFHQDPVVGWLVVVGGPGLGAFRPIYEGNNAVGRSKHQRIPLLFVPNLSKTNVVAINDKKPTGALKLELMDVITMGRTQLAFVPFCGEEFDWSELSDLKE